MSVPILTSEQWAALLRSKENRIRDLENQLQAANIKIQELQKRKFRRNSLSDTQDIQVTSKDITFAMNEPMDTAHIEELNASLGAFKYKEPRPSEFKLKIPRNFVRKTNSLGPERRKAANSANNTYMKIDEMLFTKNVDKKTWNNTLKTFKGDPRMIGKVLVSRKGEESQPKRDKKVNEGQYENFQPFSASIERKWQEVDWSQTVLDTYASRNLLEFNFLRDLNIFSPYEIEDLLSENKKFENFEAVFQKGIRTLDKLTQELMLPKGTFVIPLKSAENVEILLKECNKLFRARALVVKILSLIHKREDLLLRIMRFDEEDEELKYSYEEFEVISQDILQSIGFLSQSGLYLAEFIYLGGNYAQKVLQDEANILELFPGLKKSDI